MDSEDSLPLLCYQWVLRINGCTGVGCWVDQRTPIRVTSSHESDPVTILKMGALGRGVDGGTRPEGVRAAKRGNESAS